MQATTPPEGEAQDRTEDGARQEAQTPAAGSDHTDAGKPTRVCTLDATQVLGCVLDLFQPQPWLQLGGNETLGMGWCAVKPLAGASADCPKGDD